MINIRIDDFQYEWDEHWEKLPANEIERGWAHPGMAVTAAQQVVTCHAGKSEIIFFNETGELQNAWSSGLVEAHGITVALDRQGEHLWISDHGAKANPNRNYEKTDPQRGRVIQTSLDGEILATLAEPPLEIYRKGSYMPPRWRSLRRRRAAMVISGWQTGMVNIKFIVTTAMETINTV